MRRQLDGRFRSLYDRCQVHGRMADQATEGAPAEQEGQCYEAVA